MRRYAAILRRPHVLPLVAAMVLSRLPIGINALAVVLYLREERGSFAVAGLVAGSLAAGSGVGAPIAGRLVDRIGPRRTLVPAGILHAAALGALVAGTEAGLGAGVLVLCGVVAGLATPPTSSVLRSLWSRLIPDSPGELQAAYALDTVLVELVFISGPLLTGAIAALATPAVALGVSAVAVVTGVLTFTALAPTRAVEPVPRAHDAHWLGALASPGVRTLVLTSLPAGVGIGIVEVGIPAFTRAEGTPEAAGILLSVWSFGSLVGGLAYGALRNRPPLGRVHLAIASLLPLSLLPLAAATSVATMALLVLPAGAFIAPLLATRNELVGSVAPAGTLTEAYTWPITSLVGGIAVGSALAGVIVEAEGWRIAFLTSGALAALGAALAIARRRSLAPYPV